MRGQGVHDWHNTRLTSFNDLVSEANRRPRVTTCWFVLTAALPASAPLNNQTEIVFISS